MFDFSFGELLLLAVVALLVLGPERMPKVARLAGLWIRKARSQWNAVKAELENELADEELRRNLREASDAMHEGAQQMRALPDAVRNDPSVKDAAAVMTSLDPAQREAMRPGRTNASTRPAAEPPAPESSAPEPPAPEPGETVGSTMENPTSEQPECDPTQLSLLDPGLMTQITQAPPVHERHSDGQA